MEQILRIWERFQYDQAPSVWFVPQKLMHKVFMKFILGAGFGPRNIFGAPWIQY